MNDRAFDADLSGISAACDSHIGCQGQVGAEGQWVWSDGSPADYFNWHPDQPDNASENAAGYEAEHEDCGELYSGYEGLWNDRICSSMGPGVCYYPQPPAEECVPVANAPSKYIRVDQTLSFDDARAYCQEHFHDLASIHNAHENAQAVLACEGGGVPAILGDWQDMTGSFYGGSVVRISDDHWSVDGDTYVENDVLTIERIGDGYALTEHDTATGHDYVHMLTMDAEGTLKVFTRPGGNADDDRVWHLTRQSEPPRASGYCRIGLVNSGPGHTWEWSDGSSNAFQLWLGRQGAVADNAGRSADARIRLQDKTEGYNGNAAAVGYWHDGPTVVQDSVPSFICERFE